MKRLLDLWCGFIFPFAATRSGAYWWHVHHSRNWREFHDGLPDVPWEPRCPLCRERTAP